MQLAGEQYSQEEKDKTLEEISRSSVKCICNSNDCTRIIMSLEDYDVLREIECRQHSFMQRLTPNML